MRKSTKLGLAGLCFLGLAISGCGDRIGGKPYLKGKINDSYVEFHWSGPLGKKVVINNNDNILVYRDKLDDNYVDEIIVINKEDSSRTTMKKKFQSKAIFDEASYQMNLAEYMIRMKELEEDKGKLETETPKKESFLNWLQTGEDK